MKTGLYSVLYTAFSNLAVGLCFVPLLFTAWKRVRQTAAYRAIVLYWLLNGLVNIPNLSFSGHILSPGLEQRLLCWYDLIDTPLILFIFTLAASGKRRNWLLLNLAGYLIMEIVILGWQGYHFLTSTFLIGSGLLLVLFHTITGLIRYMKQMEHTPLENSMAFVYAALLFEYGSFLLIYVFIHLHSTGENTNRDSFLLYYVSLLLSATITCLGMWGYGIRKRAAVYPAIPTYSSSS